MDLAERFRLASQCVGLRVKDMKPRQEFAVENVLRTTSGYSGAVYFFVREKQDSERKLYKLLLPVDYSEAVSISDIDDINGGRVWYTLGGG
jgi:hypothetical protein